MDLSKMAFPQLLQLVSLGTSTVFMIFVMAFAWFKWPEYREAKLKESDADLKLATALTGLQDEMRFSRESCGIAQGKMTGAVGDTENRMITAVTNLESTLLREILDSKRLAIDGLRNAEELNTRHKEHMKMVERFEKTLDQVVTAVHEIRATQNAQLKQPLPT